MNYIIIGCAIILAFITIFSLGYQGKRKKKQKDFKYYAALPLKYTMDLIPITQDQFLKKDPNFDAGYFLFTSYCIFRELQNAWSKKNLAELKKYTGDDLFSSMSKMIAIFDTQGQMNIIEDMLLLSSKICSLTIENKVEKAEVMLTVSCYNYLVATASQRLIQGKQDTKLAITYFLELEKINTKSSPIFHCSNCRQEIKTTKTMKCPSCNNELVPDEFEWIITNKRILQEIEL